MKKYQLSKVKNVHYNFFSAERGFSYFPYNSLNCSFNTQDSYENIIENRKYNLQSDRENRPRSVHENEPMQNDHAKKNEKETSQRK